MTLSGPTGDEVMGESGRDIITVRYNAFRYK